MGLLDLLRSVGDRLGILESAAVRTSRPLGKIPTRTITLAELKTTIVMVTHDAHAAKTARRLVYLEKGELIFEPPV